MRHVAQMRWQRARSPTDEKNSSSVIACRRAAVSPWMLAPPPGWPPSAPLANALSARFDIGGVRCRLTVVLQSLRFCLRCAHVLRLVGLLYRVDGCPGLNASQLLHRRAPIAIGRGRGGSTAVRRAAATWTLAVWAAGAHTLATSWTVERDVVIVVSLRFESALLERELKQGCWVLKPVQRECIRFYTQSFLPFTSTGVQQLSCGGVKHRGRCHQPSSRPVRAAIPLRIQLHSTQLGPPLPTPGLVTPTRPTQIYTHTYNGK